MKCGFCMNVLNINNSDSAMNSIVSKTYTEGASGSCDNTDRREINFRQSRDPDVKLNSDKSNAIFHEKLISPLEAFILYDLGIVLPTPLLNMNATEDSLAPGKYLAQRSISVWTAYGDPIKYNHLFHKGVHIAIKGIDLYGWRAKKLITFSETWRRVIEEERGHKKAKYFGTRRNLENTPFNHFYCTRFNRSNNLYGYALAAAVKIKESKHYLSSTSKLLAYEPTWKTTINYYTPALLSEIKSYVIIGQIGEKELPLTWNAFLNKHDIDTDIKNIASYFFGDDETSYDPATGESGIWMHPDYSLIEHIEPHIQALIEKAIDGDLTVIPRIHWWYVHLAPILRGSGGVAELIIHSLCMKHGLDLPRWRDGVAPSIEILLEPEEEKFCSEYYLLFEDSFIGGKLKNIFSSKK